MTARNALRRAVLALGVVGSIAPGLAVTPTDDPAMPTVDPGWRRTWAWPLAPRPPVLASFVPPRSSWGAGHRGIDVAARQGQSVLAVDDGVVTHVGVIAGRGTVSIAHPSGLRSTYEPVSARLTTGDTVTAGDVIGEVADRTHCGGSCLHLGALVGTAYVNPRVLLAGGPVVLLPLTPGP